MADVDEVCPPPDQQSLIGTWRRFGLVGPVYEILAFDHHLDDGDWMMRIRVLETGEEAGYKLTDLLADPPEA